MFIKRLLIALSAALTGITVLLSGCATFINPLTGTEQWTIIGTEEEIGIGTSLSEQIEHRNNRIEDPASQKRIDDICREIALHCDRRDVPYRCRIIAQDELNAFALPGGFIYIHSAVLDQANDQELAGIIAHEIGHVVMRHGVKHLQAQLGTGILLQLAFGENQPERHQWAQTALNLLFAGYSRQDELEADLLAVRYTHAAGYDPHGLISFFEKLRTRYGDVSSFELWSSDHPSLSQRIERAQQEIARLP